MRPYGKHTWFKPKSYTHFSAKLNVDDVGFISSYVSTPQNITRHKFHPLIHRTIVAKRLKSVPGKTTKSHWEIDPKTGKRKTTAKFREIYYADHLDAHIYSYYCNQILTPIYEKKITSDPLFSDCICAYRRVSI